MRIAHHFGKDKWRAWLKTLSARQLEEWVAFYEVEARGDDRLDILAGLNIELNASGDVTHADIKRVVSNAVRPPIDAEELGQRRHAEKVARKKRAKRKMAANARIVQQAKQDGGKQHRQMVSPGDT